jgi:hypothetical protein
LAGDDTVLAKVGNTSISAYDVARAIEVSLGDRAGLNADAHAKVLESLVTSRAIALAREPELDAQSRAELEKSVARYREQLLVEQYIADHYAPKPISQAEIVAYYKEHATSFGAHSVRSFELLTSPLDAGAQPQQDALTKLAAASNTADWKATASKHPAAGQAAIEYQTGTASDQVLHPRLRHTLLSLPLRQTSATIVIDQRAYIVRVTGESETEPRPLAEVSDGIRKSLAARALKDSVANASADVRKRTQIEYPKPK